jgi:RNA polymerase sigma-70 factor (ECF subfamily)
MDELELAKRAIKRDEQAFLELILLYKNTLYRTAYAFLKNEHDAIEAVQEITVRAYQKIHTVKDPTYLKTWLIRVMINYCQDQVRLKKRYTSDELVAEMESHANFTSIEMEEALEKLTLAEQKLIHMMYFQDVKIKEIAVIERIPEGTVKSRLHKTLRTLRNFLSEKGGVDHV